MESLQQTFLVCYVKRINCHLLPHVAETTTTASPQSVVNQLLDQSLNSSTINSSQVQNVVNKLENILSAPNISLDVCQGALSVVNKLLDAPKEAVASSSNR